MKEGGGLTNFELITQNPQTLDDFLSAVQDDALEAAGCSLDLHMPLNKDPDAPYIGWKEWLEREAEEEMVYLPHNQTIERWGRGREDG